MGWESSTMTHSVDVSLTLDRDCRVVRRNDLHNLCNLYVFMTSVYVTSVSTSFLSLFLVGMQFSLNSS